MAARLSSFILVVVCTAAQLHAQEVESRTVEECQGSSLRLVCPANSVIQIISVELVDSSCYGHGNCCPQSDDCTGEPSTDHRDTVQRLCHGHVNCVVETERKKIGCGYLGISVNNDYERIRFSCQPDKESMTSESTGSTATSESLTSLPVSVNVTDIVADATMTSSESPAARLIGAQTGVPLMFIIIPLLLTLLLLLVVIATCFICIRRRRKAHLQELPFDNGLSNPAYLTYAQLLQNDQQPAAAAAYLPMTSCTAEPVYELEKATPGNDYSDVTIVTSSYTSPAAAVVTPEADEVIYNEIDDVEGSDRKSGAQAVYDNVDDVTTQGLYSEPRTSAMLAAAATGDDEGYYLSPSPVT